MRKIVISLLVCLFCLNYALSETPNLSPDLQKQVDAYQELIQTHQYTQAINLCEEALKEADDQTRPELESRLDEARRQKKIFDKLIKGLKYGSKKKEIRLNQGTIVIRKANEEGIEGYLRDNKKERYKGKWADIPVQNIYGLFDITKLRGEDKFNLAVWCFSHGLSAQAETVLIGFYQEQSSKSVKRLALINPLLTRIRNIPLPQDGFALYNETTWISAEAAKQREGILKKLGTYKGVLDKPGADKERIPWEKARTKETEHLIVKTNLSVDALNDICLLLESAYFCYQNIFGFDTSKEKLRVMVAKNKDEYQKIFYDLIGTNTPYAGVFIPASDPSNKSGQDHLLGFYNLSGQIPLTSKFLHECTHYAMNLVRRKHGCSQSPIWLDEGWATYYEASRLEGKRFVTNVTNPERFPIIKEAISKQTYIKLKDFINISSQEHLVNEKVAYPESWGLIYFLLNGQSGKYKLGLQAYMENWKKGKIAMSGVGTETGGYPQDKPGHLKLFEECMGVPIDQLEAEWKEYILQLK